MGSEVKEFRQQNAEVARWLMLMDFEVEEPEYDNGFDETPLTVNGYLFTGDDTGDPHATLMILNRLADSWDVDLGFKSENGQRKWVITLFKPGTLDGQMAESFYCLNGVLWDLLAKLGEVQP